MNTYVLLDELGLVKEAGRAALPPEGAIMIGDDRAPNELALSWFDDGEILPRPISPEAMHTGTTCSVGPCASGTKIEVFDYLTNEKLGQVEMETDGGMQTVQFDDAGLYRVVVSAPFPHLPTEALIEI